METTKENRQKEKTDERRRGMSQYRYTQKKPPPEWGRELIQARQGQFKAEGKSKILLKGHEVEHLTPYRYRRCWLLAKRGER